MENLDTNAWVDAHFHLFHRQKFSYSWLDNYRDDLSQLLGDYHPLQKTYLEHEYFSESLPTGLAKAIHVEAAFGTDPVGETAWIQSVSDQASIPVGIIGYADLTLPNIADLLDQQCAYRGFRGVRMVWGADKAASSSFNEGFAELTKRQLIYEVASLWEHCFEEVARLADCSPNASIVIEHCGLPTKHDDTNRKLWQRALKEVARRENVSCKISGIGMLDHQWTEDSMRPIVQSVIEAFGTDRCFFGSNWPVDSLYGRTYAETLQAYRAAVSDYSISEKRALFFGNASRIYRI